MPRLLRVGAPAFLAVALQPGPCPCLPDFWLGGRFCEVKEPALFCIIGIRQERRENLADIGDFQALMRIRASATGFQTAGGGAGIMPAPPPHKVMRARKRMA
ncbi:MAG: hypothetical protein K6C33_02415 [Desulfovibrio sp.]|nr:hypothetical protein [Desulfovibrio sp.]